MKRPSYSSNGTTIARIARRINNKNGGMAALAVLLLLPFQAWADELSAGDTAWMLTATALVLFMTIPGLSLFYAGMVRSKNVLSVLMQCFAITSLMTVLWVLYGYSIAFGGEGPYWGGLDKLFLAGVTVDSMSGAHPGILIHDLSDDVRNHHPGADCRRLRRAHEIQRSAPGSWRSGSQWSMPPCATGSGEMAAGSATRASWTSPAVPWCILTPVWRDW